MRLRGRERVSTAASGWLPSGAPYVFSPADLSPALWLDASDTTTITASSGSVSQWNDKSGNGRNVSQAIAASQPITGSSTQNGLNVITFDGSNDFLGGATAADWTWMHAAASTLFVVLKRTSVNDVFTGLFATRRAGSGDRGINVNVERPAGLGGAYLNYPGTGGFVSLAGFTRAPKDQAAALTFIADPTASTADRAKVWLNGTVAQTNNGETGTVNTSAPSQALRIGEVTTTGTPQSFGGDVAEVIGYPTALSSGDRQAVESYLTAKWGL